MNLRWSLTRPGGRPRVTTRKCYPEARNLSLPSVYFSRCGKQWERPSVALTSCRSCRTPKTIRTLIWFSDVFMDSVNRDISMEMMVSPHSSSDGPGAHVLFQIKSARGSRGKQFILITPQSMSKISLADFDVKVNKYAHLLSDSSRSCR